MGLRTLWGFYFADLLHHKALDCFKSEERNLSLHCLEKFARSMFGGLSKDGLYKSRV